MSFGLCTAAQMFQRFLREVLRGLDCPYSYIYDIMVALLNEHQHEDDLRRVLERPNAHGLLINTAKSTFGESEVQFLGHSVSSERINPTASEVQDILNCSKPTNAKALRRFLKMLNFYRRFIPKAAELKSFFSKLQERARQCSIVYTPGYVTTEDTEWLATYCIFVSKTQPA